MIRFDSVSKTYRSGNRPALHEASLEVEPGEFVFLVGASGSGKSSFLRLILREERPTTGTVHVLGQDLGRLSNRKVPHYRRNLGVVFQDFRLLPTKTVFDNVGFALRVLGKSEAFIHEAVPDVLRMVGLESKANRLPHELSGGEQQRVAIARAVVNKPAILLADEPTGNLDPTTSAGIMDVLRRINASGTTVLMATHDSGIVNDMKKRVIELADGHIIRDETGGGYRTEAIPVQSVDSWLDDAGLESGDDPVGIVPLDSDSADSADTVRVAQDGDTADLTAALAQAADSAEDAPRTDDGDASEAADDADSAPRRADTQPIEIEPIRIDPIPGFDAMAPAATESIDLSYLDGMGEGR
ncbi:MAG: cell division ATP-binding protein FtsE [Actinomycetota bacterium]|jgi:cell division transport system ATP-binding protein